MALPHGGRTPGEVPVDRACADRDRAVPSRPRPGPSVTRLVVSVLLAMGIAIAGGAAYYLLRVRWRQGEPVPGTADAVHFAVHDTSLAVIRRLSDGRFSLGTVELVTAEQTTLVANVGDPLSLALDAEWVVWSSCRSPGARPCTGDTYARRRSGGEPVHLLDAPVTHIALGKGFVYALSAGVVHVARAGARLAPLTDGAEPPRTVDATALAGTGDRLVALRAGALELVDFETGARERIGAGCAGDGQLAIDASAAYVACETAIGPAGRHYAIERVPLDGSARETLGSALNVAALAPADRGLVVIYEELIGGDPHARSSTLGLICQAGAPIEPLLDRSGWGPIAVRGGDLFLLGAGQVFRTSLP